ncbi:MAG: 16S rRNA (cytosine(1402)-N(4))-methyltransferase RsmH [Candidatus Pacebacteria bacterium]|nr:16S rRNA (cytosine(1402)-N(4))-methyltransferase RsmH [Candidatus Paceibacterota bacterium]
MIHTPVLLNEVLEYLEPVAGGRYIDATMNGGGHSRAILERIMPDGKVIGIEWDSALASRTAQEFAESPLHNNITVVNDSYTNMAEIAERLGVVPDGILFDLGLSSWHYEGSGRGFTFKKNEPLDMRFNTATGVPASEIVNLYTVPEIEQILRDYGEEQFAQSISESIGLNRKKNPIMTTEDLVSVISVAVPDWYKHRKIHFATKTFQALRVVANDELGNVAKGVRAAIDILKPGGRLVVISFQGHEDKIVREIFKEQVRSGRIVQPKSGTIRPTWPEQQANPRSRSAKMKVAEKI